MRYMKVLTILLRIHWLLPPDHIKKATFLDTLRIMCLALAPWLVLLGSIAYAYVNYRTADMADMTDVMCTNLLTLLVVANNIILATKKFEIRAVFTEMQKMVKKRRTTGHVFDQLYERADQRCDYIVKIFVFTYALAVSGVTILPIIGPLYNWTIGREPFELQFLPYKVHLPNDYIKTPLGWLIVMLCEEASNVCSCITITVAVSLYSCFMIYLAAFSDDVSLCFHHLDDLSEKFRDLGRRREIEMKLYLVETLHLNDWVSQFRMQVAKLVSLYVFCWFFAGVGVLSTVLFQLQLAPSIFSPQAFRAIGLIVGPLIYLWLFCLLGQMVTDRCRAVCTAAYTSKWYEYSLDLKKYTLMTIVYYQIDFYMMALAIIPCNMITYKTLVNTSMSYFMVFRRQA